MKQKYDVIIIGAGPVGLFLGLRLQQLGLSFIILDKKSDVDPHSRAIGIHPLALELLQKLQASSSILQNAILPDKALLYVDNILISKFDLSFCKKPFNYVASLPQVETEKVLTQLLLERCPNSMQLAISELDISSTPEKVMVNYSKDGMTHPLQAEFLVGCDGKHSFVREKLGIDFVGELYSENYIMGDFYDKSPLESDAALFMGKEGVIESFPLPQHKRRWVISMPNSAENPSGANIAAHVLQRLGITIDPKDAFTTSKFKTQGLIAATFYQGRMLLTGDAACVVSPIGGQGMSLGWLNAWELATLLKKAKDNPLEQERYFQAYNHTARLYAKHAIRRAGFYRLMGRKNQSSLFKKIVVRLLCNWPLRKFMAAIVTMRYLKFL